MFFSQEARSVVSTFRYGNFARIPQYFAWTLRNYYSISRPVGNDRCTSTLCVSRRSRETFEDNFQSRRCKIKLSSVSGVTRAWKTTYGLKSDSVGSLEFTLFCLPRMNNRKIPDTLHASQRLFCRGVGVCTVRSSTDMVPSRALSTGTKQKQVTWVKEESSPEDKKVEISMNPQGEAEKPESEVKQSKAKMLKKVFKEYGAVGVSFHIGISLLSLGVFYLGLSSGINMAAVLCKMGFTEAVVQSKMAAGTSTFVLAYALHKLFAPLRISVTLVSVPLIVRYLRKTGLFKPPSSSL
ncbi:protein FAM210B, mitochondrial isoform X1 [Brachyhypopomus gauderio]|uniref:protein FAM210B, mitochondrial isoform X1 n=1 Tax=Brachyhypopomus gauderio TaxID=698409 RepID=UPI00404363B3